MSFANRIFWLTPIPLAAYALAWLVDRAGWAQGLAGSPAPALAASILLTGCILRLRRGRRADLPEALHPDEPPPKRLVAALATDGESSHQPADPKLAAIVVESAPIAMLMADRSRRIVLVNRKTEDLFGYSRDELVGRELEVLIPERSRASHPHYVMAFMGDPQSRAMGAGRELFGLHRDGSEIPIEIGLNYMTGPDGIFAIASIVDITERWHAQQDLRRSNAELEQFAYVASHDLQEPLRMVASYTELLAQRYKGRLDEKADKYIYYAVDGAKRMQRLVSDLLAYSRVGSQGKKLARVDAGAVMRRVIESLRRSIAEAEAVVDVQEALPAVMADETQLHQLFQNLIGNAIKFRSEAAPRIVVRAAPRGQYWELTVADNGIGLDMQYADRIFQMFQRLHSLGQFEGSGIGLAIAKRIVERHGGKIWLESTPGQGTTFHFTLPKVLETGEILRNGDLTTLTGAPDAAAAEREGAHP